MKRTALAVALLACTSMAVGQYMAPPPPAQIEIRSQPEAPKARAEAALPNVDVPKAKCEPKPSYPTGAAQMAMEGRRRTYERDLKNYKECMLAYIDERKAATLAHQEAAKSAVEEYNATMKKINEAQEAAR